MQSPAHIAVAYYKAMAAKDINTLAHLLAPEVTFLSPLAKTVGKDAVIDAASKFMNFFTALTIRTHFESNTQAMVIYDVQFPEPIGMVRTGALVTIHDGLISTCELFFDARPFVQK